MSTTHWTSIRTALEHTETDFRRLLESVRDSGARAVGAWSIAETAAHVREVATFNSTWATGGGPPSEFREAFAMAGTVSIDEVNKVNALSLASAPERDPLVLAELVHERIELMLYLTASADGAELVDWLGGLKLPLTAVLAHTLSELLVHGRDIARAEGRAFPISSAQAKLIFEGFLLPLLTAANAAGFGGDRSDTMQPVCCELRLRGCQRVLLVADNGSVAIEKPGSRPTDVHIAADPAVMWLLMFNRIGPLGPVLRGQIRVWGRRPWRLRHLMRLLQTA
jgi:hypothetical protein